MKLLQNILFIIIFLQSISFASEWIDVENDELAGITVIASNDSHTVIKICIDSMFVEDTIVDGTTYQILTIPQSGHPSEVGKPELPLVARLVGIPDSTDITVNITGVQ